jgi:hypothetical protein
VVPFKVGVEAEEGVQNPVYNTEEVCVLCEVGTEAKETVELEHVIVKHNQMDSMGLFRNKQWSSAYILWQPLVRWSRDWPAGIPRVDEKPLASPAKVCPRSLVAIHQYFDGTYFLHLQGRRDET